MTRHKAEIFVQGAVDLQKKAKAESKPPRPRKPRFPTKKVTHNLWPLKTVEGPNEKTRLLNWGLAKANPTHHRGSVKTISDEKKVVRRPKQQRRTPHARRRPQLGPRDSSVRQTIAHATTRRRSSLRFEIDDASPLCCF